MKRLFTSGMASFRTPGAQLSKGDKRLFLALVFSAGFANQAMAQSVSTTDAAVTSLKSLVFTVAQGIFAVFLVIALVKVAKKFMGGEPDAMTSLMWLVGGVLIFFGFSALKTSLVGSGAAGGGSADGLLGQ
jgi:small-conductance mechanosensitive channel